MDTQTTIGTLSFVVAQPLDRNPAAVYLQGLSDGSKRTMGQALDTIARLLDVDGDTMTYPWHLVQYAETSKVRAALAERYAPSTANKMLSALRGVLKVARLLDLMDGEACHRAASVANVKGESLPAGRSITGGELQALMEACAADPSPAGTRDAAIIALLYSCGLRVGELCALDVGDYDPDLGKLSIRVAKRNKQRQAHVVNGAAEALGGWLSCRGEEAGALFWPGRKGGHIQAGRLTAQAVAEMLRRRAVQAGVKHLSPHDLRRTFVGDLLDAGADLVTVQKMAGHSSPSTTARYDRRPEEARRKAAGLLHVPYRQPFPPPPSGG